ncbi:hypothetical protein FKM82_015248 [Ascaphus truei]
MKLGRVGEVVSVIGQGGRRMPWWGLIPGAPYSWRCRVPENYRNRTPKACPGLNNNADSSRSPAPYSGLHEDERHAEELLGSLSLLSLWHQLLKKM